MCLDPFGKCPCGNNSGANGGIKFINRCKRDITVRAADAVDPDVTNMVYVWTRRFDVVVDNQYDLPVLVRVVDVGTFVRTAFRGGRAFYLMKRRTAAALPNPDQNGDAHRLRTAPAGATAIRQNNSRSSNSCISRTARSRKRHRPANKMACGLVLSLVSANRCVLFQFASRQFGEKQIT